MKKLIAISALALLAACNQAGEGGDVAAPAAAGGPPPMPKPVTMVDRPDATGGEAAYVEYCAMCHAPNGMGSGLLGRRLEVADLEKRDDLTADYVIQAARMGIGNMPAIPRGEVTDDELKQIADYLAAGPHGEAGAAQ